MATIPPFVAKNTHIGQQQTVKAKKFVWVPVGSGEVSAFSDSEVAIAGQINILGYSGQLNIHLILTDNDPAAKNGSCILRLNTHEDQAATYEADSSGLTVYANFNGTKQNIRISPSDGGAQTACKLSGKVNETVHLEPK
jgi:hypothetical protein